MGNRKRLFWSSSLKTFIQRKTFQYIAGITETRGSKGSLKYLTRIQTHNRWSTSLAVISSLFADGRKDEISGITRNGMSEIVSRASIESDVRI